jgi:hypothetical protein
LAAGVTVPVLASLDVGSIATAVIAAFVAVLTGLDQHFRFGARSLQMRRTAVLLKQEGWAYFQLRGRYRDADHKSAYIDFLDRIETLNALQTEIYLDLSAQRSDRNGDTDDGDGTSETGRT